MLELRLDELMPPRVILAFQKLWSSPSAVSLAQADDLLRTLTEPRSVSERYIAEIVMALVGPEPDAFAWIEAMTTGNFNLSQSVSVNIARAKESPAQSIKRQRDRVAAAATHSKSAGDRAAIENAYKDALRLMVAVSLLSRMRQGVAAKAALGSGWPLMVAVTDHCSVEEKRAIFSLGNNADFQAALGLATRAVIADFASVVALSPTPTPASVKGELPLDVAPYAFFAKKSEDFEVCLTKTLVKPFDQPAFMIEKRSEWKWKEKYRANILMPSLHLTCATASHANDEENGQCHVLFSLATRAEKRRRLRHNYRYANSDTMTFTDWNIQTAIWRHMRSGFFFPSELPNEYVGYLEEDLAWFYHMRGEDWLGYQRWFDAGYLRFNRSKTRVTNLFT